MLNNFNELLSDNLNGTVNRIKYQRYNNDIQKLEFLNEVLGLNYKTIGEYISQSHTSIFNYKRGKNKINDRVKHSIDKLLRYTLSILEQMIKKRTDLTPDNIIKIESIIYQGKVLLTPQIKNAKLKRQMEKRGLL